MLKDGRRVGVVVNSKLKANTLATLLEKHCIGELTVDGKNQPGGVGLYTADTGNRDDILNLYVVTSLPLPEGALPTPPPDPWTTVSEAPF